MTGEKRHRHIVVICSCGTVMYDCGCHLRLLETRDEACDACRDANRDLLRRQRALCDVAYLLGIGAD